MKTLNEIIEIVNKELLVYLSSYNRPVNLYEPIRYTLDSGGKRIRATLVMMAANIFTSDLYRATNAAMGIEIFHNFTLLHDDIMDNAEVRRGKPAVHKMWDQNTAILSGDAMQIIAYKLIAESGIESLADVLNVFSKTALQVCVGQQLDMDLETSDLEQDPPSIADYMHMIELKTSVLIGAALKIGALIGGARMKIADQLSEYGKNIGIAFQLQDDYLDTFGNFKQFGKRIGGDIAEGKKTFLLLTALKIATPEDKKALLDLYQNPPSDSHAKIKAVTRIFERYNLRDEIQTEIDAFFSKADNILNEIDIDQAKLVHIRELVKSLRNRNY